MIDRRAIAYDGPCKDCDCPRYIEPAVGGNVCARSSCGHNYHRHDA